MFEISLVRIFSVLMRYHYVFLVVSMSMCGLGIGGILAFNLLQRQKNYSMTMFSLAIFTGITMPLSIILIFKTPLKNFLTSYTTISLIPFLPFLLAGAFFSFVFGKFGKWSGKIYFADLIGAGAGCIAVLYLIKIFGPINITFITGATVVIAGMIIAGRGKLSAQITSAIVLCILFICVFINKDNKLFNIPYVKEDQSGIVKPLFSIAGNPETGASIVYTEWNAFARTDVVEFPDAPDIKYIYTDGDVPTTMHFFNRDLQSIESLKNTVFYLPFADMKNPKVLSIGPGGGIDILVSILGGSESITGVEVNPSIFSIMNLYSHFNGMLYNYPGVKVFLDDGRSFVKRSKEKYDLIYLALTQSATSQSASGVLTEGYIHTREAFRDYLDKLTDDGMIVFITQNELLLLRGFTTFLSLLNLPHKSGLLNMMVFTVPETQFETTPYRYILIAGKKSLSHERKNKIKSLAERIGVIPVFVPGIVEKSPFDDFGEHVDVQRFVNKINRQMKNPVNIMPVSDDMPFFLDLSFGVPLQFKRLFLLVFLIASGVSGLLIFRNWKMLSEKKDFILPVFIVYFAIIGIAYMIVEVSLIQNFILFLGHPTFAVSLVLFGLLAGSGIGSFHSQLWETNIVRRVMLTSLLTGIIIVVYGFSLHRILESFLYLNRFIRTLISLFMIMPVGFLMGIPFPSGIRLMNQYGQQIVPWLWMINGLMSVCGSLIAVMIAKTMGFIAALFTGGLLYILLFLICSFYLKSKTISFLKGGI